MRAPSIKVRPGRSDSEFPERTCEITFPDGTGCLLTLKVRRGGNYLDIDRADDGLFVQTDRRTFPAKG